MPVFEDAFLASLTAFTEILIKLSMQFSGYGFKHFTTI